MTATSFETLMVGCISALIEQFRENMCSSSYWDAVRLLQEQNQHKYPLQVC